MKKTAAGRALIVVIVALAAGCATTENKPSSEPPKPDLAAQREATLHDAVGLMEAGSAASLSKAAGMLSTNGLPDTPQGSAAAAYGARLFGMVYPDIENPFGASAQAGAAAAAGAAGAPDAAPVAGSSVSPFFGTLDPALAVLTPGPAPSDDTAADILNALSTADGLRPDSVLPPYLRALLLEKQERPPEAIRPVFEECLQKDPQFYPGRLGIIRTAIAQGSAAAELPLLAKLASELPSPVLTYTALAQANLAAGKPAQAADAAARALLIDPDSPDLVVLRAQAFQAQGDWYQALTLLDSLLRVRPDESQALALKARILLTKAKNPDAAMQVASEAETKFPNDPVFPELRGRILLARGNSSLAESVLERALQLDPARASTLALLAGSAADAQRWQEASSYVDRIPERKRSPGVLRLGWRIAMSLGDDDKALAFAAALQKKQPGDEPILLTARTLLAAGKVPETLDLVAKSLPGAATAESRCTLYVLRALAERQTGGNDAALADLRLALRENPDDTEALLAITDLLSDTHAYRRALNYLRHAQELSPSDAALRARLDDLTRLSTSQN